jgi:hypothetical protein
VTQITCRGANPRDCDAARLSDKVSDLLATNYDLRKERDRLIDTVRELKYAASKVICYRCNGMGATWHMCTQPDCSEFHKEDCPDCHELRDLGVIPVICSNL